MGKHAKSRTKYVRTFKSKKGHAEGFENHMHYVSIKLSTKSANVQLGVITKL